MASNRLVALLLGPVAADLLAEGTPDSLETFADLVRFLIGAALLVLAAAISLLVN
jgi:hypothetical protein